MDDADNGAKTQFCKRNVFRSNCWYKRLTANSTNLRNIMALMGRKLIDFVKIIAEEEEEESLAGGLSYNLSILKLSHYTAISLLYVKFEHVFG